MHTSTLARFSSQSVMSPSEQLWIKKKKQESGRSGKGKVFGANLFSPAKQSLKNGPGETRPALLSDCDHIVLAAHAGISSRPACSGGCRLSGAGCRLHMDSPLLLLSCQATGAGRGFGRGSQHQTPGPAGLKAALDQVPSAGIKREEHFGNL